MARPLHEASELGRELARAHRETAALRARVAELEAVLRKVGEAVGPLVGPRAKPGRQVATSDSGEPIYEEPDEPPEPDRPRRLRRQTWKSLGEPRLNDDVEGFWTPEARQAQDSAFAAAMERETKMRKRGAG
jgi:hypothetical protein